MIRSFFTDCKKMRQQITDETNVELRDIVRNYGEITWILEMMQIDMVPGMIMRVPGLLSTIQLVTIFLPCLSEESAKRISNMQVPEPEFKDHLSHVV